MGGGTLWLCVGMHVHMHHHGTLMWVCVGVWRLWYRTSTTVGYFGNIYTDKAARCAEGILVSLQPRGGCVCIIGGCVVNIILPTAHMGMRGGTCYLQRRTLYIRVWDAPGHMDLHVDA